MQIRYYVRETMLVDVVAGGGRCCWVHVDVKGLAEEALALLPLHTILFVISLVWQNKHRCLATYALCFSSKRLQPLTLIVAFWSLLWLSILTLVIVWFVSAWPLASKWLLKPLSLASACLHLAQSLSIIGCRLVLSARFLKLLNSYLTINTIWRSV